MFDLYPYTNFHELNQDWILSILKKFENELKQAIDYKTIHYADPLQWNITTQYAPNTVVVDENTGIAYISKDAVPSGILLSDENYWMVIFDYQKIYNKIMSGVAFNEKDNETASKDLLVNDLVWYHGDLYRVTKAISEGSRYIVGTNLVATTIESLLSTYYGKDRVAQLLNDTVNVSGDYTLNAGDIAETSSNRTEKVTNDRELDIDGNDSVHVNGATTVNRGGIVTEAYNSSRSITVVGTNTETYENTNIEKYNEKKIVSAKDIDITTNSYFIHFPDSDIDLSKLNPFAANIKDFGAIGDGVTDDTTAIQSAINQTKFDTILIPPGKYHTTKSLICRDGIRIIGLGRDTCEFINSFDTGTFTLANNVFFESLNFETDNNSGFAFYGSDVFAVNINHVDSLGGFFKHSTSKFMKLEGNFNTVLLNDCIIDCGSVDGFAIELLSNGDNTLNKDCQFRDVFIDTWYSTSGGCIKADSLLGLVLNNCIIRSHNTCLLLDRTISATNGDCTCNAEFCVFDGDNTNSSVIVNGKTELHDYNSVYGLNVDIRLNGIMYYWNGADRLQKILYGKNAFALINADSAFTNPRANGTWDFVKPAISDARLNISLLSMGLPTYTHWGVSLCIALTAPAQELMKAGICLNDSAGQLILFGRHGNNLAAKLYTNATTYKKDLFSVPWVFGSNVWVSINKTAAKWIFYVSADGVSWVNAYEESIDTPSMIPIGIGIGIDNEHRAETPGYAMIANVTQWHIENLS